MLLVGLLHQRPVQLDLGLHLPVLLDQLGGGQLDQRRALLHPVADVHVPLLDEAGNLRVKGGALVRADHPRLLDGALHGPVLGVDHLDRRVRLIGDAGGGFGSEQPHARPGSKNRVSQIRFMGGPPGERG